jgi:hypothetical protein
MGIGQDKLIIDICSKCGEPFAYLTKPNLYYYGELCWSCRDNYKKMAYLKYKQVRKKGYWGQRHFVKYQESKEESTLEILPTDYHSLWFKAQLV